MPTPAQKHRSAIAVLKAARSLIDTPEKWCQRVYAKGSARCAYGAIITAARLVPMSSGWANGTAADMLASVVGLKHREQLTNWNDARERTHAEVLDAFDRAIGA